MQRYGVECLVIGGKAAGLHELTMQTTDVDTVAKWTRSNLEAPRALDSLDAQLRDPRRSRQRRTDKAWALARAITETVPGAWHVTGQYANNRIESDHACLKARLRPMRGLKTDRSAQTVIRGHAFIQNLRRGHYELGTHAPTHHAVAAAFDELTGAL